MMLISLKLDFFLASYFIFVFRLLFNYAGVTFKRRQGTNILMLEKMSKDDL